MRHGILTAAVALFAAATMVPISAQQPAPPQAGAAQPAPQGGVQVGVPGGGRGSGGAAPAGGRRGRGPAPPAPRGPNGRVLLQGRTPAEKGVWLPAGVVTTSFANAADIPFQPWARALYEDRQTHRLEPHARCKPSGAAREMQTPYAWR